MALRAELVGPYCLILVTSSVCADQVSFHELTRTARMSLLKSTAAALGCDRRKFIRSIHGLSVNN